MPPPPTVYLLMGFPGTGKLTIARALSALVRDQGQEVRVVDNHFINNPIFGLIEQDGVTPLPPEVWERVGEVREAVLRTIESLSPRSWSFIFTSDLVDRPEDRAWFDRLLQLSSRRQSVFAPVRLLCDLEELSRRVVSPERRVLMKSISVEELTARYPVEEVLDAGHPNTLTLDVTEAPPEIAAQRILDHAQKLSLPEG